MSPVRLRVIIVMAVAVILCGATASTAGAHALLVGSTPLDNEVVKTSPKQIVLTFAEPLERAFSSASLADDHGRPVQGARVRLGRDGVSLVLDVPDELPRGAYSVSWHVLSDDGHPVEGLLVFGVGSGTVVSGRGSEAGSLRQDEAVVKWLVLLAVAGALGGLAAAFFVFTEPADCRRALGTAFWSVNAALLLGCVQLGTQVASLEATAGGASWSELVARVLGDTRWGASWIVRQALLALLAATAFLLLRRLPRRAPAPVVLLSALAAVAVAYTFALSGHSAGLVRDGRLAVTVDALHLLSGCLWVGVVAVAALILVRASPEVRRISLRPIARVAAPAAVVAVSTGLYSAGRQIVRVEALQQTLYGNALLAKTTVILGMGLLGAANAMLVRPGLAGPIARLLNRPPGWTPLARGRLGTLVCVEACLGAAVLLTAGILAAAPPGASALTASEPRPAPTVSSKTSGELLVSVSVKPNHPGENVFVVRTASTRRPAEAPVTAVSLGFREAGGEKGVRQRMSWSAPGTFQLGGDYLDRAGPWKITAVVERKGLAPTIVRFDWTVGTLGIVGPGSERGGLEQGLTLLAALLLVGLVAVSAWVLLGKPFLPLKASSRENRTLEELARS